MKKALSFALVGCLALSLLTACGGGTSSSASSVAASSASTSASETEKEPITLRFVSWQTNHDEGNRRVADAYTALNPHITIEFDYVGDMNSNDYLTKTDIMLMGGEEMDIVMTSGLAQYTTRAAAGSYLNLDPYFEAEGTVAEDTYNAILRIDGATYGIPTDMKYNCVLINKDMLDAAGLDVPGLDWTWDDYRTYAKALTTGSGADTVFGSYFHSWGNVNLYGIGSAKQGSTYFNDDKTLTFENPALANFLQLRYDMENTDKSSTPLADIKSLSMNYRDQFFSGNIAMLPMGTFMLSDIGNEKYAPDFVTTFARMPLWEANDPHYTTTASTVFSVARTSKHPQEAYDFLRFWSTEGVVIKGMFISNEKGADRMESVMEIVKNFTDKVDVDALTLMMQDPKWVDSYEEYIPEFQSEVDSVVTEETDKYLLGTQSLEDTINALMTRGNAIIAENS